MFEVEVKVPTTLDPVRDRLRELDATARGTVEQVDVYYDHPERSFVETDEALRIRREDGEAALTYKGPRVDDVSKTRRELETDVGDPDAAGDALEALGFAPAAEVHKVRERYAFEGYLVTLDAVEGLGEYVEVEAIGHEDEIDDLRRGAERLLERLGVDPATGVRASYLELLTDARE